MPSARRHWFRDLSLARKLTVLATATSTVSVTVLCTVLGWHDTVELRSRLVGEPAQLAGVPPACVDLRALTDKLAHGGRTDAAARTRHAHTPPHRLATSAASCSWTRSTSRRVSV